MELNLQTATTLWIIFRLLNKNYLAIAGKRDYNVQ